MSVGPISSAGWLDGTTGLTADKTITLPTYAAGDLILIIAAWKTYTITASVAGYTEIAQFADGAVATGAGTGSVKIGAWYKIASGSETDPTLDFSTVTGLVGEAALIVYRKTQADWSTPVARTAAYPSSAGPATITASATVTVPNGGCVQCVFAIRDDSAITLAAQAIDDLGDVITWDTQSTLPTPDRVTATGDDLGVAGRARLVTTGAAGATLELNVTSLAAAETGSVMWIVIGDQAAAGTTASPTAAALTLSAGTPTVSVTPPDAYGLAVVADSPTTWFRLSEASGSPVDFYTGSNGTLNGSPTQSTSGVTFVRASNQYISVPDQAKLDLGNGPFTIEAVITPAVITGQNMAIVGKWTGAYFMRTGGARLDIVRSQVAVIGSSSVDFVAGTRYHVAITKSGTTSKTYVNGVDISGAMTDSTMVDNAVALGIGSEQGAGANDTFDGKIGEVALYPSALSAARLLAHYNALPSVGTSASPTAAALTLSRGTPTVAAPFTGQPTAAALTLSSGTPTVGLGASSQPTTAALTLTAGTPTVVAVGSASRQPTAIALTLSTGTPTVAAPRLAQPTAAALVLAVGTPTVTAPASSSPTAVALTLSRGTPVVAAPFTGQPTAVALTISAGTPTVAVGAIVSAQPTAVALTLSVGTPTVVAVGTASRQPTAVALTLSRGTPTVAAPFTAQPTAAALTLTAATPTVRAPRLAQPTAAALVLAVGTPTVLRPVLSSPTAAALTLSRGTPTVTAIGTASRQPTAAALVLSVGTPTVAAGGAISSQPTVAALILSTATPTVSTGAAVSSQPTAAALTLSRGTPTVVAPALSLPTARALTLGTGTPLVTAIGTAVRLPTAATLTLATATPPVAAPRVSLPTPRALSLGTGTPTVAATQNRLILPTYAELTLAGHAPAVVISGHLALEPLPAALVLTGHAPAVEIHSTTPLPEFIYGFAIVATGDSGSVGTAQGGATVRSVEGGSTAVSTAGPSARVTIR